MSGIWLASYVVLWVFVVVMAVVIVGLLRTLGVLFERYDALAGFNPPATSLKTGQQLPDVMLQTLTNEPTASRSLRGKKTALSIVSAGCSHCRDLLNSIAKGSPFDGDQVDRIVLVSISSPASTRELLDGIRLPAIVPVLVGENGSIKDRWGVRGTPVTVIVDEDLKVVRQIVGPSGSGQGCSGHHAHSQTPAPASA